MISVLRGKLKENEHWIEWLYYAVFSIYYFDLFLWTTMFDAAWVVPFYHVAIVIAFFIIVVRLIQFDIQEWKKWLLAMLILGCSGFYWLFGGDKEVLILAIFLVAAKDIPFRNIVKIAVGIGTAIMVVAFVASQVGIVEDLVYFDRGSYHHALGISYTTDMEAHVLFLLLGFFYLMKGKVKIWVNVLLLVGVSLIFYFVRARNNYICMIFLILGSMFYRLMEEKYGSTEGYKKWSHILAVCMSMAFIIGAAAMVYWTIRYEPGNPFYDKLNQFITGRLYLGHQGYVNYGVSLWGQVIPQIGAGRTSEWQGGYFFLDSSYILVLLEKGLVVFSMMCVISTYAGLKNAKKRVYVTFLLAIIALQCVIEHHWMDISYNYFLIMVMAKMEEWCEKIPE